jgi:polysaccharide export outer membrane protein
MPSSGPSPSRIKWDAARSDGFYQLFETDQSTIETLRTQEEKASRSGLASLAKPEVFVSDKLNKPGSISGLPKATPLTIQPGDLINVTIFSSGGLFASPDIKEAVGSIATQIPPQRVDETGSISVPFAGRIPVKDREPHEIEEAILEKIQGKAIDPWVVVSVPEQVGGKFVSVSGDVVQPRQVPIPPSGLRLVDAIAHAGGSKAKAFETLVTVTRGPQKASSLLGDIYDHQDQNIELQNGDTIVLTVRKWTYTTLGALGQRTLPFENPEIKLMEALGLAGGLADSQANPRGIFVFRFEKPSTIQLLGRSDFKETSSGIPTVYLFNLTRPAQMFAAAQFSIRDKDTIFVGNAGTVGLMKALDLFNAITAPARSGLSTAAGFQTLSN